MKICICIFNKDEISFDNYSHLNFDKFFAL